MNQLDVTHMKLIQCSLALHVSGINFPINRNTIRWITAYNVQLWYCRLRPTGAGLLAVCTVHTVSSPAPLDFKRQYQCWTLYAVIHYIVLLMMGILMPESCWPKKHRINVICVASSWFITWANFMMHGHVNVKIAGIRMKVLDGGVGRDLCFKKKSTYRARKF
jgi:hypothetical protein